MILVLGGTADGRQLTEMLLTEGRAVVYSSVSGINAPDPGNWPTLTLHTGAMDGKALLHYLQEEDISLCVDATHPYAREVSANAMAACAATDLDYIRLERPGLTKEREGVTFFDSYDEVMAYLSNHDGRVLATTGSRELEHYSVLSKERLILRVLPTSGVLKKCEDLGYRPKNIVALQGPFTTEMNVAMLRQDERGHAPPIWHRLFGDQGQRRGGRRGSKGGCGIGMPG